MCGLIGYISKTKNCDAGKHVINQLQDQLSRGKEGFGVMEIDKQGVNIERATELTKATIDTMMSKSSVMFFHHRYPTSTPNTMKQTHPFFVSHDELTHDFWVMHNGVLKNQKDLFKLHTEELGYVYNSVIPETTYQYTGYQKLDAGFNDSESLAIEIARYFDGETKIVGAIGDTAFLAVKLDKTSGKPVELIWGCDDGRPLEFYETEHGILIASEIDSMDAERIADNTFETLNIQKYFNSKAKTYNVRAAIQQGDMEFLLPEPVVAIPSTTMGFGNAARGKRNSTIAKNGTNSGRGDKSLSGSIAIPTEDEVEAGEMLEDIDSGFNQNGYMTPREQAFETMGERVCADISVDIMAFFEDLGYAYLQEDDAMIVANRLNDLLLEKIETANSKVRPHFEEREGQEMEDIIYEDGESTINQRATASAERFDEITDQDREKDDVVF